jgi:hypothetical protein
MRASHRVVSSEGAVAIIDALGFKGIYQSYDVQDVVDTLRRSDEEFKQFPKIGEKLGDAPVNVACLSDTVVMVTEKSADEHLGNAVLRVAGYIAAYLHRSVADSKRVPLVYRGCIAAGTLAVSGQFFVGPAVDEAAEWHEQADASVVWLTPSAAKAAALEERDSVLTPQWSVPLKGVGPLSTLIVNPLWYQTLNDVRELDALIEKYLAAFERKGKELAPNVTVKRQRTAQLLADCARYSRAWLDTIDADSKGAEPIPEL